MTEACDGREVAGMGLHRRRSVLVRMTGDGRKLETARITNSPAELRRQIARAGVSPRVVLAGKLLGRVGTITRSGLAATFAASCGAAPIEASSGDVARHRLLRAGDRQLSFALHLMAITQVRCHGPARPGPTTCANEPRGRAARRRCAA